MDTLIAQEGYDPSVTNMDGYLNARNADPQTEAAQQARRDPSSQFDWATRGALIPISPNQSATIPLLLADNYRNLLIIQNNSIASGTDVAPDLFIALDGPVQTINFTNPITTTVSSIALNCITLQPQEGLVLDVRCPTNAIYVAWGASNNAGGTVFTLGMFLYGRTTNAPPYAGAVGGGSINVGRSMPGSGFHEEQAPQGPTVARGPGGMLLTRGPDGQFRDSGGQVYRQYNHGGVIGWAPL